MDDNVYEAPKADLIGTGLGGSTANDEFYIVSRKKFLVLYFSTIGAYRIYWFYKNWRLQKDRYALDIWTFPRAYFSLFFCHSLFDRIDARLQTKPVKYFWMASDAATNYVILDVVLVVCSKLSDWAVGVPFTPALALLSMVLVGLLLAGSQAAINQACDDPDGQANTRFTRANYAWISAGIIFWLVSGLGYYLIFTGRTSLI